VALQDLVDERLTAGEVLVELALAGGGGAQHVPGRGGVDAALVEQVGRGLEDALAGAQALGRRRCGWGHRAAQLKGRLYSKASVRPPWGWATAVMRPTSPSGMGDQDLGADGGGLVGELVDVGDGDVGVPAGINPTARRAAPAGPIMTR
jgi:hypothetical protein